jgi:hypothetical protein
MVVVFHHVRGLDVGLDPVPVVGSGAVAVVEPGSGIPLCPTGVGLCVRTHPYVPAGGSYTLPVDAILARVWQTLCLSVGRTTRWAVLVLIRSPPGG